MDRGGCIISKETWGPRGARGSKGKVYMNKVVKGEGLVC